ncbi:hypothetical protein [Acidiphilium iwatense]|uniref:Uncharacterized protein n=1 Tax=Acidiphilium iwatense TaxID=768198 RepID=A0ABS9DYE0_9PROT|nr:hypothetical protein [Acidiphilium iwatense]MCF3947767.1 hypothetical protein [Acidiphilium iwatense]
MKKSHYLAAMLTFILCAMSPAATAQWFAHVSQPDVFGQRTVEAASIAPSGDGLIVQCDQKNTLDLAYIFQASRKDLDEMSGGAASIPVDLLLKVDGGKVMKLGASLRPWNNHFAGFVVDGRDYATVEAVEAISKAARIVSVGVSFLGNKQSDNFGASGSTAAMATVMKDCKLNDIKPANPASQALAK